MRRSLSEVEVGGVRLFGGWVKLGPPTMGGFHPVGESRERKVVEHGGVLEGFPLKGPNNWRRRLNGQRASQKRCIRP